MEDITPYSPKLLHNEFHNTLDLLGLVKPEIQVLRSVVKKGTNIIYYTFRPKIKNNNKSAVGEVVYGINIKTPAHSVQILHLICEQAYNWFLDEMNKVLGAEMFRKEYNKEEMEDTLQEAFNSPIQYID